MSEKPFAVGDVVTLLSGGQAMTVEVVTNAAVHVVWLSKDNRLRRDHLLAACLRRSDGEFDGIGTLIIEGVTHTRAELDGYLEAAGHA